MSAKVQEAWSVEGWCQDAKISQPLYFKERRNGRGPRMVNVGRRTIIVESPANYYARIADEAKATQPRVAETV